VYERCEALGLPVTVNVGVPGPKFRARTQDPFDLDDVLIDFPGLTVIGAHMGHPWEDLLIRLMMKYDQLYLSNSAYLARYIDPAVVKFMGSSRGLGKLIFASDEPLLPMARALEDARALPISAEALAAFLGGAAEAAFRW
jgi:predicted TIM-barrel fold metal-dependent hydrolase